MNCSRCGARILGSHCIDCQVNEEEARRHARHAAEAAAAAAKRGANEAAKQRRIAERMEGEAREARAEAREARAEEKREKEEKEARFKWEHRECPQCAEMVKKKAKLCIHCKFEFTDREILITNMEEESSLATRFNCHPWEGREALARHKRQEKARKERREREEREEKVRREKRAEELGCSVDELDEVEEQLRKKRLAEAKQERDKKFSIKKEMNGKLTQNKKVWVSSFGAKHARQTYLGGMISLVFAILIAVVVYFYKESLYWALPSALIGGFIILIVYYEGLGLGVFKEAEKRAEGIKIIKTEIEKEYGVTFYQLKTEIKVLEKQINELSSPEDNSSKEIDIPSNDQGQSLL